MGTSRAVPEHVAHWDDVEAFAYAAGPLRATWRDLGSAAASVDGGVGRFEIEPGARSTPAHRHGYEEEFVFVLGGSGWSWQDGETYEIGPRDVVFHRPQGEVHTLIAGRDGLDVLVFGPRRADEATHLPHAGIVRINETWVLDAAGPHPFEREAAAGELPMPEAPSPRNSRIVGVDEVEPDVEERGETRMRDRSLGTHFGSVTTGLSHAVVAAGACSYPLHCHSAEEELFVVLSGEGVVVLGDDELPVRAGSIVSRPPASRVAHRFRASARDDLEYLAWSTRVPSDIAFYPRSGKVNFRGIGLITRLERLDYWDGEA